MATGAEEAGGGSGISGGFGGLCGIYGAGRGENGGVGGGVGGKSSGVGGTVADGDAGARWIGILITSLAADAVWGWQGDERREKKIRKTLQLFYMPSFSQFPPFPRCKHNQETTAAAATPIRSLSFYLKCLYNNKKNSGPPATPFPPPTPRQVSLFNAETAPSTLYRRGGWPPPPAPPHAGVHASCILIT